MDSTYPLITSVIALLKADAGVSALVDSRVYVSAPENATYPFVTVRSEAQPWATASFSGMKHILRIQAFSTVKTAKQAVDIKAACSDALDRAALSISGFTVIDVMFDGISTFFLEDDGKTWQSVVEIGVYVQ